MGIHQLTLLLEDVQVDLFELDAVLRLNLLEKVLVLVKYTLRQHQLIDLSHLGLILWQ